MKDLTPEIFKATTELLAKKAQDYNADRLKNDPNFRLDDPRPEYFPFGDKSYVHMLWTKVLRIRNLVDKEGGANFEGIEDSLMDICAYSAFYYAYLQEKKDVKPVEVKKEKVLLQEINTTQLRKNPNLDYLKGMYTNIKIGNN